MTVRPRISTQAAVHGDAVAIRIELALGADVNEANAGDDEPLRVGELQPPRGGTALLNAALFDHGACSSPLVLSEAFPHRGRGPGPGGQGRAGAGQGLGRGHHCRASVTLGGVPRLREGV